MAAALSLSLFFLPFFSSFRWKSLFLTCWGVSVSMPSSHRPGNSARYPTSSPNPIGTRSDIHTGGSESRALALLALSLAGRADTVKTWPTLLFRDPSPALAAFQLGELHTSFQKWGFPRGWGAPHAWRPCKVVVTWGKEHIMAPPEWRMRFHMGKAILGQARGGDPADSPHQLWGEDSADLDM